MNEYNNLSTNYIINIIIENISYKYDSVQL